LKKILSTGLLGVQRAALDVARSRHMVWGGACMRNRMDAYGRIPDEYFTSDGESGLHEAPSTRPSLPALHNAREADGTLVVTAGAVPPLCKRVLTALRNAEGQYLIADPYWPRRFVPQTVRWIVEHHVSTLNITGAGSTPDDPLVQRFVVFFNDVVTYAHLYHSRGVKIWTL
jgi:hypothetical protein